MLEYLTINDVPESLKDIAEDIGIDAFKKIIKRIGGSSIYFPNEDCITKPIRNRVIRDKFRGSYSELAVSFGISVSQIRNIVDNG